MRKKNNAMCWIIVIIILLSLLLGTSLALIWGRVFAPSIPDSQITVLWRFLRDNCVARGIMSWLRSIPLYDALCYAAHSSDGTLAPLMFLLELLGAVSFVFGAVNEVKSTRSYGMMMSDVINYVFPLHGIIQVLFYGLFAIAGSYACHKNIGIAAMLCLSGLGICFLYSVFMAAYLFGPQKYREKLVYSYIKAIMTEEISSLTETTALSSIQKSNMMLTWQRNAGARILDYAKYVGEQWNSGVTLQIHRDGQISPEELLIRLTICGLTTNIDILKKQLNKNGPSDLDIGDSFAKIFPDANCYGQDIAEYVLYKKGMHFEEDKDVERFRQDVRRCSQIWEQLFNEVENEKRRAQMAHAILSEAQITNWHIFAMLSFGLLNYLDLAKNSYSEQIDQETLVSKMDFLFSILQVANDAVPEEYSTNISKFTDAWGELIYLAAGIIQWMVVTNCVNEDIGEWIEMDVLPQIRKRNVSAPRISRLKRHKNKYIVLAYLLLTIKNPEKHRNMSVYILQYLEPVVSQKMSL